MGIQNFPAALQPIIQTGYLERKFEQALRAKLAYRSIADQEEFAVKIGETLTKTRAGLLPAATTALTPSANTNFDNGLSPGNWGVEQYTLTLAEYGYTLDLNIVTNKVGIASQFVQNAIALGEQAARTMDTLAANALFNTYLGGNTRLTTTATSTTQPVDDVRGFQTVFSSTGQIVPVSTGNPLTVTVNGVANTVTGYTVSGTSTAPGGIAGSLTFGTSVTGTTGFAVVSGIAPSIIRPNNRATTAALVAGDTLPMISGVLQAATNLRNNAVPTIDGLYNCYADPQQIQGLFNDSSFQNMFRGAYESKEYRQGEIFSLAGVRFIPNNLAPQQTLSGLSIHRALVCGKGALVEGNFAGQDENMDGNPLAETMTVDKVRMITRAPMDRLQQIVAQSWSWMGAFTTPSDTTANPTTLPTATNAAYKRAVIVESL
ncbi:MAG: hypothetical protein P4L10_10965 [Acidobacteriaceae bacterium]|nr:hypothetical protein [Acidobacteriaceae bacterium]